jgi:hypothetical protein
MSHKEVIAALREDTNDGTTFRSTPVLELAQALLCQLSLDELGQVLGKAERMMKSPDGDRQAEGRLLRAQAIVAMRPKWDPYRKGPAKP